MPKDSFFINRIKSFKYAFKGLWWLLQHENSIKVHFFAAVLVTLAGFYFQISNLEWITQFLAIGMVMSAEGLNSAIEKLADFVEPNHQPKIGVVKDIAAGAVVFSATAAIIVGFIIYLPKILN